MPVPVSRGGQLKVVHSQSRRAVVPWSLRRGSVVRQKGDELGTFDVGKSLGDLEVILRPAGGDLLQETGVWSLSAVCILFRWGSKHCLGQLNSTISRILEAQLRCTLYIMHASADACSTLFLTRCTPLVLPFLHLRFTDWPSRCITLHLR